MQCFIKSESFYVGSTFPNALQFHESDIDAFAEKVSFIALWFSFAYFTMFVLKRNKISVTKWSARHELCSRYYSVDPGVSVNDLLPGRIAYERPSPRHRTVARSPSISDCLEFQQDVGPTHRVHDTIEIMKVLTPDFIQPILWPLNSPDLNL